MQMESMNEPKRVVLRFHVQHELEETAINNQFFALYDPDYSRSDCFSHMMAPNESSKMHIVLDINCKSHPTIDNNTIEYQVFKVKKKGELYVMNTLIESETKFQVSQFEKLNSVACEFARRRCERIKWGTDRYQSEELVGDRPVHTGQSPPTFVS